jgi:hypothetical protein
MKTNTFSLFLLLFSSILFGQKDYNARLPLYGFVSELGISPSEEIWVAAGEGDTFYTKQFGQVWNIGPFGSFGSMSSASVQNFERINFFSEDIMMLIRIMCIGLVITEKNGKRLNSEEVERLMLHMLLQTEKPG